MATATGETNAYATEAHSCRKFASILYKAITENINENIISSPLSVHIILSYLSHGANGITASEMINGLFIKDINQLHIRYKNLLTILNLVNNDVELRLANAVFVHENTHLLSTFSNLGREYYNFILQNINFQSTIESTKIINNWIADKTNGMIDNIVDPDDITDDISAILVNGIYFKGRWQYPFNTKHTEEKVFHITKDIDKQVLMMVNKHHYTHGKLLELKSTFIEIPYSDNNLSMMIILPDKEYELSSLERNFNWNSVTHANTTKCEIVLYLPKFKIECTFNLNDTLGKIGFLSMFEDTADFSGMTDTPIKMNKVIQKVYIDVDEEGSEAAAATAIKMRLKRSLDITEEFIVNRPFMFIIHHKPSDIPLFIGSVRDIGVIIEKDEL